MTALIAALAVGGGLALVVVSALMRVREREAEISRILDLPFGEHEVEQSSGDAVAFLRPGVDFTHRALERVDLVHRISRELERARIALRPGEFGLAALGSGLLGGLLAFILTGQALVALIMCAAFVWGSWVFVVTKAQRRTKAFEAQLPEALSVISSSLQAGHTFLHSIEAMVEESEAPMSEEFERVLSETRLGDPLLEALDRMSERLQIKDLAWVVQAIRIQQSVGGKLAELLSTLGDFMRAREEIRREVRVLTAEGRMSALVLGLLPVVMFVVIKTMNPAYLEPMLHGGGLVALVIAGISVLTGMSVIRRMAKIDV